MHDLGVKLDVLDGGKGGRFPQSLLSFLVNSSNSSLPGDLGGVLSSPPPPPLSPPVGLDSSLLLLNLVFFLNFCNLFSILAISVLAKSFFVKS